MPFQSPTDYLPGRISRPGAGVCPQGGKEQKRVDDSSHHTRLLSPTRPFLSKSTSFSEVYRQFLDRHWGSISRGVGRSTGSAISDTCPNISGSDMKSLQTLPPLPENFQPSTFKELVAGDAFGESELKAICTELHDLVYQASQQRLPGPTARRLSVGSPLRSRALIAHSPPPPEAKPSVLCPNPAPSQQQQFPSFLWDSNVAKAKPCANSAAAEGHGLHIRSLSSEVLNSPSVSSSASDPSLFLKSSRGSSTTTHTSICSPFSGISGYRSTHSLPRRRSIELIVESEEEGEEDTGMLAHYEIVAELGRGGFGTVNLAIDVNDGNAYAIKTSYKGCTLGRTFSRGSGFSSPPPERQPQTQQPRKRSLMPTENEINVMKTVRHRNLVQLHGVIEDRAQQQCHLVMEYIENGPVSKARSDGTYKPVPCEDALYYLTQISAGIDYLHRHDIVHRDIKPENILIGKGKVAYLSDFGMSELLSTSCSPRRRQKGTMAFLSPEAIESAASVSQYGKESDAWSFGVTLYAILYGKLPFLGENYPTLIKSILHDEVTFPSDTERLEGMDPAEAIPSSLHHVLERLLEKDPRRRMTMSEFRHSRIVKKLRCVERKLSSEKLLRSCTGSFPRLEFARTLTHIESVSPSPIVPQDTEVPIAVELVLPVGSVNDDPPLPIDEEELSVKSEPDLSDSSRIGSVQAEDELLSFGATTVAVGQVRFSRCCHDLTPNAATVISSFAERIRSTVRTQRLASGGD